jgi:tRNA uridine 5-carbamoylmethylation protein Kti12
MRTLILLSAIPGSGKSTWAKKYQKEHPNTFIVSSDEIRLQMFGKVNDFSHEAVVWKTFMDQLNNFAETYTDVTVIADATNLQNKFRKLYCEGTPKFDKHVLVRLDIPYEICLMQNKMRDKGRIVPEDVMKQMAEEMEEPSPEILAMYDEYLVVKDFMSPKAKKEELKAALAK